MYVCCLYNDLVTDYVALLSKHNYYELLMTLRQTSASLSACNPWDPLIKSKSVHMPPLVLALGRI